MDTINDRIRDLRKDYTRESLDETNVHPNPFDQFTYWLQEAVSAEVPELNAFHLATIGTDGFPDVRVVLLREFDEQHGFFFYTNYNSKKGKDISASGRVCMNFFWPQLERQVRIKGEALKAETWRSDAYFQSRPAESKIGASVSPQSERIHNRKWLEDLFASKKAVGSETPRPANWGGYQVRPVFFEFWQGRPSRLHDRVCYERKNDNWEIFRLAP